MIRYCLQQRMRSRDLVITIGADEKNIPDVGGRDEMLQEMEARYVKPLQVVDEKAQADVLSRQTLQGTDERPF